MVPIRSPRVKNARQRAILTRGSRAFKEHSLVPAYWGRRVSAKTLETAIKTGIYSSGQPAASGVTVKLRMESKLGIGTLHTTTA